jgi:hypothetical protein
MGIAVLVRQETPLTREFPRLPIYSLARVEARYWGAGVHCELCRKDVPLFRVGRGRRLHAMELEPALAG